MMVHYFIFKTLGQRCCFKLNSYLSLQPSRFSDLSFVPSLKVSAAGMEISDLLQQIESLQYLSRAATTADERRLATGELARAEARLQRLLAVSSSPRPPSPRRAVAALPGVSGGGAAAASAAARPPSPKRAVAALPGVSGGGAVAASAAARPPSPKRAVAALPGVVSGGGAAAASAAARPPSPRRAVAALPISEGRAATVILGPRGNPALPAEYEGNPAIRIDRTQEPVFFDEDIAVADDRTPLFPMELANLENISQATSNCTIISVIYSIICLNPIWGTNWLKSIMYDSGNGYVYIKIIERVSEPYKIVKLKKLREMSLERSRRAS